MVMREGATSERVHSYLLPWYVPRLLVVAGTILLAIFVGAIFFALFYWQQAADAQRLAAENESLKKSVEHLDQLEAELDYHRRFTRKLAGLVGIDMPQFADSTLGDQAVAMADDDSGTTAPRASAPTEDLATPLEGVLVSECAADPNNRPRGLPILGRLSRGFHPASVNPSLRHNGIDIAAREGSPVRAPADGTVIYAGPDSVFGLLLIIDHGGGFQTLYGHNSRLNVRVGETVQRGDIIAISGNTGESTAPHLHYEIRRDGQSVDPTGFLGQ